MRYSPARLANCLLFGIFFGEESIAGRAIDTRLDLGQVHQSCTEGSTGGLSDSPIWTCPPNSPVPGAPSPGLEYSLLPPAHPQDFDALDAGPLVRPCHHHTNTQSTGAACQVPGARYLVRLQQAPAGDPTSRDFPPISSILSLSPFSLSLTHSLTHSLPHSLVLHLPLAQHTPSVWPGRHPEVTAGQSNNPQTHSGYSPLAACLSYHTQYRGPTG